MNDPSDLRYPVSNEVSLLPVIRALSACHAQVERVCSRNIASFGLTHAQFDILATLGDTTGLTCKDLGERTLITKGTLTPVLDRLEAKGLVRRAKGAQDSRQVVISLTPEGQAVYERTFLPHVATIKPYLSALGQEEQDQVVALLQKLQAAFALVK